MENKTKILVVDDEETLCEALKLNLELEGFEVDTALSAEEALSMDLGDYSLFLLDIMMGDISGIQMAQILRRKESTANVPIIFCTAKDTEEEMVAGLDLGADDYITKPYSLRNVTARVKAVLRRSTDNSHKTESSDELCYEGIRLIQASKSCVVDGETVRMPRKEFELLATMMSHPGRIFTRAELLSLIWSEEVVVLERVVDVNITRLRSKLGKYGKHIITRAGYGYGFTPD